MHNGLFISVTAFLLGTSLAAAQAPAPFSPEVSAPLPPASPVAAPTTAPGAPIPGTPLICPEPAPTCDEAPLLLPLPPPGEECGKECPYRIWAKTDALLWWLKHADVPPLVTSGTPLAAMPAVLGQPGTGVLLGGSIDTEEHVGGRVDIGYWFCDQETCGLEGSFLLLPRREANLFTGSPGFPVLGQPFIDAITGAESVSLTSFPGLQSGNIAVSLTDRLSSGDLNFRFEPWKYNACSCGYHVALLAGFRYLEFSESLSITENDNSLLAPILVETSMVTIHDQFDARNFFYGGQVGIDAGARWCKWSVDALIKVAVGETHEIVGIGGSRTVTAAAVGSPITLPGGLLALPTNSGRFSRNRFAVLPEADFNIGYQLSCHVRARVGYSFLYLSEVARPGDQIDRVINQSQILSPGSPGTLVGPARPAFSFKGTDFWAQGVNVGLEFRF
jgi:hypothetical protein